MYAVVQLGSLQYKVSEGDIIDVQKLETKDGESLTLDQVLLFANDKTIEIGQPYLKTVSVKAKSIAQKKGEKVVSFKYWRRKDKAWKKGHRQKATAVLIEKIESKK